MAKISQYPVASSVDGTESSYIVQAGASKKSLLTTIADWILKTYAGFLPSGIGTLTPQARTLPW